MKRLEECMERGHRVCINLRGRNRVNSVIDAKVVAFDKHWNLLIRFVKLYADFPYNRNLLPKISTYC